MKKLVPLLAIFFLASCSIVYSKQSEIVFRYEDFGPQVIAYKLIGMEWWQWQPHGDSRPRRYDIKVVVYRDTELMKVKERYPVVAEKEQDFRYVQYDEAIRYFDKHIQENVTAAVTARLIATRKRLVDHFQKGGSK